ncbi:hypothetical protein PA25_05260 [Pseudoalteromonas sp. A25]|uniref:eCIS core domain-containing protein n=1 Tax=Pseudoalteromonas sp. A25 TaxID=116092 RepID=UPI0012607F0D|nr:DUF4157 domain-containing protein [Pseudoalteromonas sp. A25]BBN80541.1 hypothetical protein PA25_05260 [Pseudoalteromonas sp. A25]
MYQSLSHDQQELETRPVQRQAMSREARLKDNVGSMMGVDLSHVNVHTNSSKPAQLNAHAYAQGSEVHIAPGQERHLGHELAHIGQQMQGRVQATTQFAGQAVNDDPKLEHEADVIGAKAESM